MLIKDLILRKVITGEITLLFRRWKRAAAKSGGTQMTQLGVLRIEAVDLIDGSHISKADIKAAGFDSEQELFDSLPKTNGELYRILVSFIGEDPRISLRQNNDLSTNELDEICAKLAKMDARALSGAWTQKYLQLIRDNPNTAAAVLAAEAGQVTAKFKPQVRKLKALGLTESLDVGYKLSPRGLRVFQHLFSNRENNETQIK